jgi:phenylacetate-CoA ligase
LGRQDNTVAFYGCNINPEDIQNVILQIPELSNTTENFAIHPFEDKKANKRLEFWIELCEGAVSPTDLPEVTRTFLNKLATLNQDFRESIKMIPEDRKPELRFFAFGESPISGQDIRLKKRYIV